ncbi:MAG: UDP-3-O-(3-hydroxymyristoyl)glucosamine N-acyltransferase [Desulfobacterales bacterium]
MKKMLLMEIASAVGGEIQGDPNKVIQGAAPFEEASEENITFAASPKFIKRIDRSRAGAVIVPSGVPEMAVNLVVVKNPLVAFAKTLELLYPSIPGKTGIHSSVSIGENFIHGSSVSIGPSVVIGDNVTIGERVVLHPGVVIGSNVTLGDDVVIYPNVTILERCRIGSRVIVHAGSVIGSDGFGFAPDGEKWVKIPHKGTVRIDDDVEIGAGNTIDRGTLGQTWIQKGVKTDNLVHVAHNVTVGENSAFAAQAGIAGSTTLGRHTVLAGQAGVGGHLTLGDYVTVGPQAGVSRDISEGRIVSGTPEMPHKLWLRVQRTIPQLPELKKRIDELEKKLKDIEEK